MKLIIPEKAILAGTSVGGETGSQRINIDGQNYQYKPSAISQNTTKSKLKNYVNYGSSKALDVANYGEFIGGSIVSTLLDDKSGAELSPTIQLTDKVGVVTSRYLKSDDDFAPQELKQFADQEAFKTNPKNKNPVDFDNLKDEKAAALTEDQKQILKKDLTRAIAASILIGDHDVNSGNMMVIKHQGQYRISRIDFGHAGNDLIKSPSFLGGGIKNKKNCVLDFINRNTVAHMKPSLQKSKLWLRYPKGVVPSRDLANALKEMAEKDVTENIKTSMAALKAACLEAKDIKDKIHIIESLDSASINKTKDTKKDIKTIKKANAKDPKVQADAIEKWFAKHEAQMISNMKERQTQMKEASILMGVQLDLNEKTISTEEAKNTLRNLKTIKKKGIINSIKKTLSKVISKERIGQITWFKTDSKEKPITATIRQYCNKINPVSNMRALLKKHSTILPNNTIKTNKKHSSGMIR